jgi:hypothetical protein
VLHARQSKILDVGGGSQAFGRDVRPRQGFADDGIARGVLERRIGIELEVELVVAEQAREPDAGAAGLRPNFTIGGDEIFRLQIEALRGEIDHGLARGRRGLPDLHAAALDAGRAGGSSLVRRQRGVALDIFYFFDRDAEFLGCNLGNCDPQPLAEIDLAAIQSHGAIAVHRQEGINLPGIETAGHGGYGLRQGTCWAAGQRKADNHCAALEQRPAREANVFNGCVHASLAVPMPP